MSEQCGPELWHGSNGGYNNHGCRGPDCTDAHRRANRGETTRTIRKQPDEQPMPVEWQPTPKGIGRVAGAGKATWLLGDQPNMPGALCKNADPHDNPWFPHGNANAKRYKATVQHAKETCAMCPHQQACAEWATDNYEVGIWGGLTDAERKAIREARKSEAA